MGKSEAWLSRDPGEFGGRWMAARTGVWVVPRDASRGRGAAERTESITEEAALAPWRVRANLLYPLLNTRQ